MNEKPGSIETGKTPIEQETPSPAKREPHALYQGGRLVAKVLGAKVDLEAKEIHFGEVYESDYLLLPEECEYQRYKIMIQRIAYASKIEPGAPQKGRVLRTVVADMLGFREQ